MSTLRCIDLTKTYGAEAGYALGGSAGGVSFDVEQGELFALLGPSGCGKTTTLRIIGGFVEPTSGRVELGGEDVTRKPPYARPTNTVFQSYALFPHLSVGANVEFGLKMDRVGRKERQTRTREALGIVGMEHLADRRIAELSGGQQQRAALARAMVKRPGVLLLDEPFGALDLRLRRQMQDELVRLKQATGTTFVHVTHDQDEACAIADRIAVMDRGQIVQVDTPVQLYRAPRTAYVAQFLNVGTVLRGKTVRQGGDVSIDTGGVLVHGAVPQWAEPGMRFSAVLPPDQVTIAPGNEPIASSDCESACGTIEHVAFTGSAFAVNLRLVDGTRLVAEVPRQAMSAGQQLNMQPGSEVVASWRRCDVIIVDDVDPELAAGDDAEQAGVIAA
ncbi:ABC transporter ATP-binding protein [Mycobacterium yunnanensis]|uniref:ABC-type quaternary amine transporter n=1 Tax=Mycobacterium yunnanensis TaxID=368477 RepID=A0A9X3BWW2_9MYCO|nr:ABC transporter ATP-binding protein [Mycobacterium yunnanensis]MCV7424730.1 ABC transporter ATP-binding protein [Mycobacterium yunnanensis]